MSHTNSTTNYSLPQFITTDKPAWLTDVNNAFLAIDTGMNNAQTKADTADNNATQALADASAASTAAATADAKGAGAIASIADTFDATTVYAVGEKVMYNSLLYVCSTAVTTPGPWTGSTNWTRVTVEGIINNLSASNIEYSAGVSTAQAISANASEIAAIKPTVSIGGSYIGANGHYQIPANILAHSIIIISMRRYGYSGSTIVLKEDIVNGAYSDGVCVFSAHDKYEEFNISSTGDIFVKSIVNWDSSYIDLVGIF